MLSNIVGRFERLVFKSVNDRNGSRTADRDRYIAQVYQGEEIIFVLDETSVLYVSDSEAELQGAFEGVDVENGVYRFFDDLGMPLVAEFTVPNRAVKMVGPTGWVRFGRYRLRPSLDTLTPHLTALLSTITVIEPNRYFPDLEAVRRTLCL
jgi:hypothetical protein